ncbi:hypothetical protein K474DRAFT_1706705 [Panus rudis PR-1116 ss-1]|nr:hypothetical protein K474DRAFT_1706705 [Panus rudis PR-1116 ss-1]
MFDSLDKDLVMGMQVLSMSESEPNALDVYKESSVDFFAARLPRLQGAEILIRVEVMIEDPIDWRNVDTVTQEFTHSTHGIDFSGTVVKVGESVKCGVAVGDHVVGFVLSSVIRRVTHHDTATKAQYIRLEGELAWVVPPGTFSHEAAAKARLGRFRYMFGVPQ